MHRRLIVVADAVRCGGGGGDLVVISSCVSLQDERECAEKALLRDVAR